MGVLFYHKNKNRAGKTRHHKGILPMELIKDAATIFGEILLLFLFPQLKSRRGSCSASPLSPASLVQSIKCRPSSHENAIVPFHLRSDIWNVQIGCSHENGTIACRFCLVLRQERSRSADTFSICLFRREWNGTIAYCSSLRVTFLVVLFFGTEQFC